jgi:uncharacterized protein YceK
MKGMKLTIRSLLVSTGVFCIMHMLGCATISTLEVANGKESCYDQCGTTPYLYGGSLNAIRKLTLTCNVSGERGLGYIVTYPLMFPVYLIDVPLSIAADTFISPYTLYQQVTVGSICVETR